MPLRKPAGKRHSTDSGVEPDRGALSQEKKHQRIALFLSDFDQQGRAGGRRRRGLRSCPASLGGRRLSQVLRRLPARVGVLELPSTAPRPATALAGTAAVLARLACLHFPARRWGEEQRLPARRASGPEPGPGERRDGGNRSPCPVRGAGRHPSPRSGRPWGAAGPRGGALAAAGACAAWGRAGRSARRRPRAHPGWRAAAQRPPTCRPLRRRSGAQLLWSAARTVLLVCLRSV